MLVMTYTTPIYGMILHGSVYFDIGVAVYTHLLQIFEQPENGPKQPEFYTVTGKKVQTF